MKRSLRLVLLVLFGLRPAGAQTPAPASNADLYNLLFTARKTAVGQPLVENQQVVCGPEGDATNQKIQALNDNKNRTDEPSDYVAVTWKQLNDLSADRVTDFQGAPVSVVGYLSHRINVERGESTNCHLLQPDEVDWHLYLTNSPAQGIADAVVVEATPRVRPHHKWRRAMLTPLVDTDTQVRISGWLLYDLEHVNVIGKQRATVWEVHPITRIEVQKNGHWADLDSKQWMQTANASAESTPKRATAVSGAQRAEGNPSVKVWVNTGSGVYHCSGTRWYGRTTEGVYMTQAGAQKKGFRSANGRVCQ
jgi:hypothetical protein